MLKSSNRVVFLLCSQRALTINLALAFLPRSRNQPLSLEEALIEQCQGAASSCMFHLDEEMLFTFSLCLSFLLPAVGFLSLFLVMHSFACICFPRPSILLGTDFVDMMEEAITKAHINGWRLSPTLARVRSLCDSDAPCSMETLRWFLPAFLRTSLFTFI